MAITIDRNDTQPIDVPRGLTNVVVAETAIGDVRGEEGFFHYRGVSGVELATEARFEDAWHLVALGGLPQDGAEAAAFRARTASARAIPESLHGSLSAIATSAPGGSESSRMVGSARYALSFITAIVRATSSASAGAWPVIATCRSR